MGVLVRELAALYAAFAAGQPSPLPELPVQYADFAVWQRAWLQGEALRGAARLLAAAARRRAAALELPTDRPRPAVQTLPRRQPCRVQLPRRAVRRAARRWPARGRHALHDAAGRLPGAAGAATPARTTSLVGTPIAGRSHAEIGGPHRLLRQHAGAARAPGRRPHPSASCWAACARRRWAPTPTRTCPSSSWSRRSQPERDLSRTPLFQVMLRPAERARAGACALPGLRAAPGGAWSDTRREVRPARSPSPSTPAGFAGALEYSTDLFDAAPRPRGCSGTCSVLLEALVRRPGAPLSPTLPLLTPTERHQAAAWSGTPPARLPGDRSVHALLRGAGARARPDAVAVAFGDASASPTGELDARANQLARHLRAPGRGPGRAASALCAGALAGAGRRAARHPQGRRRLRAARPGLPARAPGLHAGGRAAPRAARPQRRLLGRAARRTAAAVVLAGRAAGAAGRPSAARRRTPVRRRRAPGLRHLHLRLHRPAQGRR